MGGISLILDKEAEKNSMEWKSVNSLIIYSRATKPNIIQCYTPTENAARNDCRRSSTSSFKMLVSKVYNRDVPIGDRKDASTIPALKGTWQNMVMVSEMIMERDFWNSAPSHRRYLIPTHAYLQVGMYFL